MSILKCFTSSKIIRIFAIMLLYFVLTLLTATPPEGKFNWNNAEKMVSGIRHAKLELTSPRIIKMHAVRVDTANPRIYFITTQCSDKKGQAMPDYPRLKITTKRQKTLDFFSKTQAGGHNMIFAINASPWRPWEKPFNHKYACIYGFFMLNGAIITPQDTPSAVFVITTKGSVDLRLCCLKTDNRDIDMAIPGFSFILKNGQKCIKDKSLHPRTFFGLSKDKRYAYFVTVDGRSPGYSEGLSTEEGAVFMKYLGAYSAINMDGGGSTTLIFKDPKTGKGKLVNTPPGSQKSGFTRPVANSIGVCVKK